MKYKKKKKKSYSKGGKVYGGGGVVKYRKGGKNKLTPKQKSSLDKDGDGKITGNDFKMLRK